MLGPRSALAAGSCPASSAGRLSAWVSTGSPSGEPRSRPAASMATTCCSQTQLHSPAPGHGQLQATDQRRWRGQREFLLPTRQAALTQPASGHHSASRAHDTGQGSGVLKEPESQGPRLSSAVPGWQHLCNLWSHTWTQGWRDVSRPRPHAQGRGPHVTLGMAFLGVVYKLK